jgi:putative transposase
MGLNQKRRAKRRVPKRERVALTVPVMADRVWSADFMSDALYYGTRFRTFNVIDDFNREALGYPDVLRLDNGPEFTSGEFIAWTTAHGIRIQYIQPGKPNQNAFIERFNKTYRDEVLDLYLFRSLEEVREISYPWMLDYYEARPHDALGDLTPGEYLAKTVGNSTLQLST